MSSNKKLQILMILSVLMLCFCMGCATNDDDNIVEVRELTETPSPLPIASNTPKPAVIMKSSYKMKEKFPIGTEKKLWGYGKVNRIEKIRFNDWSNAEAMKNSVNYCYSVNITLKRHGKVKSSESIIVEPEFRRNNEKISSPCDVGWSGFSQNAEFYEGGEQSVTIEVCVQPEQLLRKSDSLVLLVLDSHNTAFMPVKISAKAWGKAVKGPKLQTPGKKLMVTSVTGAKYAIYPRNVYYEKHYSNKNDITKGAKNFFDIDYTVWAGKAPKQGKYVSNIKGFGKNAVIVCQTVLGLQVQGSHEVLYERAKHAVRREYDDNTDLFEYVDEGSVLKFGYHRDVRTNRVARAGTNDDLQYVRVRVEFPDEANARPIRKRMKFAGRYLVYEIPVTVRKLRHYYK